MKEALEQCSWNILPTIQFVQNYDFSHLDWKTLFFHHEEDIKAKYLRELSFQTDKKINIIIGPEGWLSEKEVKELREYWFLQVYLWSNILRTETVSSVVSFYILQV
jgi:RsmE family RNA methyltransferase